MVSSNIGIYIISNLINGKVYIGQSRDLKTRKRDHFRDLRNNQHVNRHLQNAWNKDKEESFKFTVLENCKTEELDDKEYYWMVKYKSHNSEYGYNIVSPINTYKHIKFNRMRLEDKHYNSYFMRDYNKEELISYLQETYYMLGRVPTSRDLNNPNLPTNKVFYEVFGSYKNALIEADLFDFVEHKGLFGREEYTKEDVIVKFKNFIDKYNRFPNYEELRGCNSKLNIPTNNIIIKHFGSIDILRKELGFDKEVSREKERKLALIKLKELYKQEGRVTARSIDKSPITKSGKYYRDNFGNLSEACRLAGVPYALHVK